MENLGHIGIARGMSLRGQIFLFIRHGFVEGVRTCRVRLNLFFFFGRLYQYNILRQGHISSRGTLDMLGGLFFSLSIAR